MSEALEHVRQALRLLSLSGESAPFNANLGDKRSWKPFTMCLAEDIDRVHGALPSPWLQAVSQSVREAWEELKMAEAALSKGDGR